MLETIRLQSDYLDCLETSYTVEHFNEQYAPLIALIKEGHNPKGQYHNIDHLLKTGYLAFLTTMAFLRHNATGAELVYEEVLTTELSLVVKAALLHDYCYLGDKDDAANIAHTQSMVRTLAVEHDDVLSAEEAKAICKLIEYTHYDFNHPQGVAPARSHEQIYFDILRDCDQLYACVYFNKNVFIHLYEDIGKRFSYNVDDFVLRNKQYVQDLKSLLKTDFAQKVYNEVINELLSLHDNLYYTFPNCHVEM